MSHLTVYLGMFTLGLKRSGKFLLGLFAFALCTAGAESKEDHEEADAVAYFTQKFQAPCLRVPEQLREHPRLFHTQDQLDKMRQNYEDGREPWKSAGDKLIAAADAALKLPIKGAPQSDNVLDVHIAGIEQGVPIAQLALAWHLTGNDTYAEKSASWIDHWASQSPLPGITINYQKRGCPGTDLGRGLIHFGMAYDLLVPTSAMTPERKKRFLDWLHAIQPVLDESQWWVKKEFLGRQYYNNHLLAGVLATTWTSILTGDLQLLQWALCHPDNPRDFRHLLNGLIYVEGQPMWELIGGLDGPPVQTGEIVDRYRHHEAPGKGFVYATGTMFKFIALAEIFENNGIRVYDARGDNGESLQSAIEYYARHFAHRDVTLGNGYFDSKGEHHFFANGSTYWASPYEVANYRLPGNTQIEAVLKSVDRSEVPPHPYVIFISPVLTHGLTLKNDH